MIDAIRRCHFRIVARRDRRSDSGWAAQYPAIGKPEERVDCRRNRDTRGASQKTRAHENGSVQNRARETTATQAPAAQGGRETDAAATRTRRRNRKCAAACARTGARTQGRAVAKAQTEAQGQTRASKAQTETQRGKGRVENTIGAETQTETKPPRDEFQSLLKNLAEEQKQRKSDPPKKPQQIAKRSPEKQERSPLEQRRIAGGLAQAIKQQITPCWKIQAGAKDAANMQVAIRMRLNPDGSLGAVPQIQDQGRIGRDPFFPGGRRKRVARVARSGVCADQAALRILRRLERNRVYL